MNTGNLQFLTNLNNTGKVGVDGLPANEPNPSELTMVLSSHAPSLQDDHRARLIHALRYYDSIKDKGKDSSTTDHKLSKELNPPELLDHIILTSKLKFQGFIFLEMVNIYDSPESAYKPIFLDLVKRMMLILTLILREKEIPKLAELLKESIESSFTSEQLIKHSGDILAMYAAKIVQSDLRQRIENEYLIQNNEEKTEEIPVMEIDLIMDFKKVVGEISDHFGEVVKSIGASEVLKQIYLEPENIYQETIRKLLRYFVLLSHDDQHAIVVNLGESFKGLRGSSPKVIMTYLAKIIAKKHGVEIDEEEA